ncbi:MAG: hypothetical protein M0T74_02275 [Desulfitobacterium hafniense]|nr:hypothetical protein [Desulfitobacterium hafniense]
MSEELLIAEIDQNELDETEYTLGEVTNDTQVKETKETQEETADRSSEERSFCFSDLGSEAVTIVYTNSLWVILLGALVSSVGLFLVSSPTSGLITQVAGSVVFLLGVMIITA